MRCSLVGNGPREHHLRQLLLANGHTLPSQPPWDVVVLSLPRSDLPRGMADQLPCGQILICGQTDEAFDELAKKKQWQVLRVLKDEIYTQENAWLSAEGAIFAAMELRQAALRSASCLVVGYGRIGKALTEQLRGIGAHVTVAARRKQSREEAGSTSVSIEDIVHILPHMDVIFNTVPSLVLNDDALRSIRLDALLLELASAPYGFDLESARRMNLNAHLKSGIPGQYCPQSAAQALYNYLNREVFSHA
ncbi:MAG: hypothetical protein IJ189_11500 [Clostridia bacterium]|nr:hypothetical protein [Clostridia bacterium]